jgi:hypothetical protein
VGDDGRWGNYPLTFQDTVSEFAFRDWDKPWGILIFRFGFPYETCMLETFFSYCHHFPYVQFNSSWTFVPLKFSNKQKMKLFHATSSLLYIHVDHHWMLSWAPYWMLLFNKFSVYSQIKLKMYTCICFNILIVYFPSAVTVNVILSGIYLREYEPRSLKNKSSVFYLLSCVIVHVTLDSTSDNVSQLAPWGSIFFLAHSPE